MPSSTLWIVGPGRLGLALGLALHRAGGIRNLHFVGTRPEPPRNPLFMGSPPAASYSAGVPEGTRTPGAVLIAVPDDRIGAVAEGLEALIPPAVPVLHTSGVHGSEVLAAVAAVGNPVGSIHPLVAIFDPVQGADSLAAAWFAVEGDPASLAVAGHIVALLRGRILPVDRGAKPLYHAAAVFASNYSVALLSVAERLMASAGAPADAARAALADLARGAVNGVAMDGPAAALTGPLSRGDAGTIGLHLGRLSPSDRVLYSVLARTTLELAKSRGLDAEAVRRVERILAETE